MSDTKWITEIIVVDNVDNPKIRIRKNSNSTPLLTLYDIEVTGCSGGTNGSFTISGKYLKKLGETLIDAYYLFEMGNNEYRAREEKK